MKFLSDDELERSAIVANCRMNRERELTGSNGYSRELGFNPLDYSRKRVARNGRMAWLDLCCGTGRAVIEAARLEHAESLDIDLVGVDLVGMFHRVRPQHPRPTLIARSLTNWQPTRQYDLITCVNGLHSVGDKLGLIARTVTWLLEDGRLVANIDIQNLKLVNSRSPSRQILADLRRAGIAQQRSTRRLQCVGWRILDLPYRYLGADDQAGPNYTGQPAIDSYYERVPTESDRPMLE